MADEVTPQLEDMLLELRLKRRALSEKELCRRFGLSRSKLQRAVKRARKRAAEARDANCSTTAGLSSGK